MSVDLDANKGPTVVGVNAFLAILSCSSVALRFLSRHLAGTPYWFDDWMILVALPFVLGVNICNFIAVHYGFGRHEAALPANATSVYLHNLYFDEMIYNTGLSTVKFSILIFYSRIFPTRRMRIALWCVGGIVLGWLIAMNFAVIFQCIPIHKAWNFAVPGRCINVDAWFIGQAVPNIATDIAILAMPLPVIWTLQIPLSQKMAVCAIFLLGSL
ncbi:hypothetical protein L228DRAFT_137464 [Xylona heveae TC161]|uniref:Rhodopsin domain-containing protein n=1 Tax=Xylona heveae (strain CBS 132557 / TC161) TaxID=1328760 RepID=A0A165H0J2_XYLHT|nr:hypothetical protein L228DRAFT_137464 [Xylona heveae TC161]KZF22835.1 hypothetical protein L228DRAFT_137464 [Xylona heveae TC161]